MRRRKTFHILREGLLITAAVASAAIITGGLASTWLTSSPENFKGLQIEYVTIDQLADPPVIEYETGIIERTHDVKVNEFTYEEAQTMLKLAQAEAGNQGEDGMWLVLSTVWNRKQDPEWPGQILEIINEHHTTENGVIIYQFESVKNGSIDRVEISQEAHDALARIEKGEVAPQIVAFERKDSDALDKYFMYAFTYKDHKFYTKKQ